MSVSNASLDLAPELSLDDLRDVQIPLDLLELLPIEVCREFEVLPLRLDQKSGTFSFAFVDKKVGERIENLRVKNGWMRLSGFRISRTTFDFLLQQVERELQDGSPSPQGWTIALIEDRPNLQDAFKILLQSQNYRVVLFESENEFLDKLKSLTDSFGEEEDLLHIAENQKLIPYQAVVARSETLEAPKSFSDKVWSHVNHLRICLLDDRWLHPLLESSSVENSISAGEFNFYLRHEDYYHAALECLKQGNLFQAVELLEQVKPENAYYGKSRILLGKAFLKKRNFNKACFHFQKAYDHWCEDPDGLVDDTTLRLFYHLAYTFEKLGRLDDALKLYERVAAENPLYREVGSRIARIKKRQQEARQEGAHKMGLPAFSKTPKQEIRYEKIEEIGKGGMGIVYRAKDSVLGREVALKVLNSHFKHDEKIVETFLREAKSLASLNHLHIVTIFDAGIENGNYYISMEFIEGKTVRDLLKKKGFFRLNTVLALSKQVLKALSYAHSKNVIHRDITTNNMMLTETKIIKLMDFGLARVVNQLHSEQSIIGGTPYFMSPEQVEGAPIDHRTDVYSFGVCLYEMLTGQVPFAMENPGYHHLHTEPADPRDLKPDIPESIAKTILKCLRKKTSDRYQSAEELLDALKIVPTQDEPTFSKTKKSTKKKQTSRKKPSKTKPESKS